MRIGARRPIPLGELVCACGMLAAGAFIVIYGLRYPVIADGVVGPGLMPLISGIALTVVSAVLVWRSLRSPGTDPGATGERSAGTDLSLGDFSEDETGATGKPTTVAGILILLGLAALLAPVFGLIPMLGLLVFVCVFVFEREGFMTAALMSIGSMVVGWLLFARLFEVPLPVGSFWRALGI